MDDPETQQKPQHYIYKGQQKLEVKPRALMQNIMLMNKMTYTTESATRQSESKIK